jgi:hypothetical protein
MNSTGGLGMSAPNRTDQPDSENEDTANVTPLLSDDGRDFLDGTIGADKYLELVRHTAAANAKQALSHRVEERRVRRMSRTLIFASATVAYAILGGVTLASKNNMALSIVAFGTAALGALAAFRSGWHRD